MPAILQDKEKWEQQYRSGRWSYLAGSEEFARYAIIAAHACRGGREGLRVLDVGCGEGVLLKHFDLAKIAKYTGLDLAQSALDKIELRRESDRFVCSSIEEFTPDDRWDVIIFNEVLYYTADPIAQIQRFEKALLPGGILIVSIFKKTRFWAYNNRCARAVEKYFAGGNYTIVDAVELSKIYGKLRWQIFVVKPAEARNQA